MANAKQIDTGRRRPSSTTWSRRWRSRPAYPCPSSGAGDRCAERLRHKEQAGQRHHRRDTRSAELAQPRRAAWAGGARDVPSRQPRHALHGLWSAVTVGLIALVCDMLLRNLAGAAGNRTRAATRGRRRRHPDHPAIRRGHVAPIAAKFVADGGITPSRVSCRRHVGAFTRNPSGLYRRWAACREGRALSRSESCHAASLHRQPGTDLHGQERGAAGHASRHCRSHRSPAQSGRLAFRQRRSTCRAIAARGASRRRTRWRASGRRSSSASLRSRPDLPITKATSW